MPSIAENLRRVLKDALALGSRADKLDDNSGLLGSLPELDSMAVATVLTAIEEHFDVTIDDDDVSAEIFETFGALRLFVERKLSS